MENVIRHIFRHLNSDLDEVLNLFNFKVVSQGFIMSDLDSELASLRINESQFAAGFSMIKLQSGYLQNFMIGEARRSYLNDLYSLISRYSIIINRAITIERDQPLAPEFSDRIIENSLTLLFKYISSKEDKEFLDFFRKARNCLVHYDGNYSLYQKIDFEFDGTKFDSESNIGKQINWSIQNLHALYNRIKSIYDFEIFFQNPHFKSKMLG